MRMTQNDLVIDHSGNSKEDVIKKRRVQLLAIGEDCDGFQSFAHPVYSQEGMGAAGAGFRDES